jgi:hypothetical protein
MDEEAVANNTQESEGRSPHMSMAVPCPGRSQTKAESMDDARRSEYVMMLKSFVTGYQLYHAKAGRRKINKGPTGRH